VLPPLKKEDFPIAAMTFHSRESGNSVFMDVSELLDFRLPQK